ncbi:MAG: helix-turn-helix transcriptional regulator [Rhodococcus sp. (in: high G+C Gram-positive bacteria)]|uniref:helix-turn-helix transcriptional regulator n=1 Tax=Rhodococcus sp. TaxID=1831 RepID=UPI003BB5F8CD
MLEVRAERLCREILALAGTGADITQLHGRAIELVDHTVRSDLTCWALIDPGTLTVGSMTSGHNRIPREYEPLLAESEFGGKDPATFADLARSGRTVVRASDLPAADVAHSLRHGAVWRPLGLDCEARFTFIVDGFFWGAAGFVRSGPDFTDRELEFLTLTATALAVATRAAAVHVVQSRRGDDPGPAVVLTDPVGDPIGLTAAARDWQDRLAGQVRLAVLLRAATVGARSSPTGVFRARIHDGHGYWVLVRATALVTDGDEGRTVVTIEPAPAEEFTDLLFTAYALTARERDVCADVSAGLSTAEIALRRCITSNTVQDHLKAVYAKTGAGSRAELAALLAGRRSAARIRPADRDRGGRRAAPEDCPRSGLDTITCGNSPAPSNVCPISHPGTS